MRSETNLRSSAPRQLFKGIGELYTLDPAAKKRGRGIGPGDLGLIPDAAVAVENGKIVWFGSEKDLPSDYSSKDVAIESLNGAVVTPAFIECHTHLIYSGNRAGEFERKNQGETYQSIAASGGGILSTVKATRGTSEEELTSIGQKRVQRFLKQGVATIEIKSGYTLTVEDELKMLRAAKALKKARIVPTFLGAHAIPKETTGDEYLELLIREALPRLKGLSNRVDIFIEKGYFSEVQARRYLTAAKAMGYDILIHADQMTRCGGAGLAVELGARSAEHLLQINDEDASKLARSEVTCVLLPSSDLYTKTPYPPARALLDQGGRVAIATDFNPGTAPSADLALAGVLARIKMKMSFAEVLAGYTISAAYALGLENEIGSLSLGKSADFCVLEAGVEELFLDIGHQPVERLYRAGVRLV